MLDFMIYSVQFSSVTQSCPTLCNPMNCSTPCLPVHHQLPELTQTHVHRVVDAIRHLILCRSLLLSPIPHSIRVFSNESTLRMRWPKYWSFRFSIFPSKEHPGLISFRMDWLDLLAVQGTLKSPAIPCLDIYLKEMKTGSQSGTDLYDPLSLQYYSQQPRQGSNISVHQQKVK